MRKTPAFSFEKRHFTADQRRFLRIYLASDGRGFHKGISITSFLTFKIITSGEKQFLWRSIDLRNEFACSLFACMGSLRALRLPPTVSKHANWVLTCWTWLIGWSKLPIGVNVSVDGCLSLHVSPVMDWWLVQGDPTFTWRYLGSRSIHCLIISATFQIMIIYV